jgi:hypothetical protein
MLQMGTHPMRQQEGTVLRMSPDKHQARAFSPGRHCIHFGHRICKLLYVFWIPMLSMKQVVTHCSADLEVPVRQAACLFQKVMWVCSK